MDTRRGGMLAVVLLMAAALHAQPLPSPTPFSSPSPFPSPPVPASPPPLPRADAIDALLRTEMGRLGMPGVTAVVMVNGQVRWEGAYGVSDLENQIPARPQTSYRFGSIAKTVTAVAVLQLVEKGRIDLPAPVERYLSGFPKKPWPVTIIQLLSHQGGIRSYKPGEWTSTRHYPSARDAISMFKDDPLDYEPGTRVRYTTHGYTLLGAVVEAVAGRVYADHVRHTIFEPAGMETAQDDNVLAIIPNRAQGYERAPNGELRNSTLTDTSNKTPGGGLCGTAEDVGRFGAALLSGRLLARPTFERMLTPQTTRDGQASGYGLGIFVAGRLGFREAWHTGAQQRVSNVLYLRPDEGVVVAIMSNLEGNSHALVDVARRMAGQVLR